MNREEILNAIKTLALSQGFYGRLYERIKDDALALDYLEKQNFKDVVDIVMFFEC